MQEKLWSNLKSIVRLHIVESVHHRWIFPPDEAIDCRLVVLGKGGGNLLADRVDPGLGNLVVGKGRGAEHSANCCSGRGIEDLPVLVRVVGAGVNQTRDVALFAPSSATG